MSIYVLCPLRIKCGYHSDHRGSDADLAVNPYAVIEVTPLIGTESDLESVGEAGDESILERTQNKMEAPETDLTALMDKQNHNFIFRSTISNKKNTFLV